MLVSLNEAINLLKCVRMFGDYHPTEEEVMQMRLLDMALQRIEDCADCLGSSIAHMKQETSKLQEEKSTEELVLAEIEKMSPHFNRLNYFREDISFSLGIDPSSEKDLKKSMLEVLYGISEIENLVRGD